MKKSNLIGRNAGLSLSSALLLGGLVFTAGSANAGFFDQINQSLESISADLDKAKGEVADVRAKADEAGAEAKVKADQTKTELEETRQKGDEAVNKLKKGLASFSEN